MSFEDTQSLLYDVEKDPKQIHPLDDPSLVSYLLKEMSQLMKQADAPSELFERFKINTN